MGRLGRDIIKAYDYCVTGVWQDTRNNWWVKLLKTLNLSVRAFVDGDIQGQACNMTFRTMLALVPAMALILAVGKGFGLQEVVEAELFRHFPAQQQLIQHGLKFVDSYLSEASEGAFVGVGVIFLLYTLISLLLNVEEVFDRLWNVRVERTIWRQITDYTAILLILPVLVICAGGMSALVSQAVTAVFKPSWVTPMTTIIIECGSYGVMWLFFTLLYVLVPNTHVTFSNAVWCGLGATIGYGVLQWLFVTGQVYVARYNAIYGGIAFLPLFMLWLQLVWVVVLTGSVICYAWQNVLTYNFNLDIRDISNSYRQKIELAVMAVIVKRFEAEQPPATQSLLCQHYGIPPRLVTEVLRRLVAAELVTRVEVSATVTGYNPALDPARITIGEVRRRLNVQGRSNFIPGFQEHFAGIAKALDTINAQIMATAKDIPVGELVVEE